MKNILYLFLIIGLMSCDGDYEYVRFKTAQPKGVKISQSFNGRIKGEYINCDDSGNQLIITDNMVLNSWRFKFKSHRNDLEFDSTITVDRNNDRELSLLFSNEGYQIEINGDTIHAYQTNIDTIFRISEKNILKKFNRSYFLNSKQNESFWNVSRLDLVTMKK